MREFAYAAGKMAGSVLLTLLLLFPAPSARAGGELDSLLLRYNTFSSWCSPEKVYLHFDRTCYTSGETVWFRGWMQEASARSSLSQSNFIYVEVLDGKGETVSRVKIKRGEDGFPGYIDLPYYLETGDYTIRAYSLWQLNNDTEYLFNDKLRIIGSEVKHRRKKDGPADMKISFWPEGGRYFAGQKAVVGFKVTDKSGRSVDFSGFLVSSSGEQWPVSTIHDGMGVIYFLPKPDNTYSLRDASGKLYALPLPSESGATVQLWRKADNYYVSAIGYGGGEASLVLRDPNQMRPLAKIELDGKKRLIIVDRNDLNPGINHVLLVDSQGTILAERLFFIRDVAQPLCRLDIDRSSSVAGGIISLTGPDGEALDGDCSVSVVKEVLKGWQQSDGITSYMGLSSELRGRINEPYYYFDPDIPEEERDAALDALMMIQGWRYYDLEEICRASKGKILLRYPRERVQEIRGHISRRLSSKMPKNFSFTFMIPEWNLLYTKEVDQARVFIIDSLDFPENTKMLINIGTSRLGAGYLPRWDGDPSAKPHVYSPAPGYARGMTAETPLPEDESMGNMLRAAIVTASYADNDVLVFGKNYREDLEMFSDMTLVEYVSMKKAMFEYDGENMYNRNRRRSVDGADDDWGFGDFDDDNESGRVKLIVENNEEAWWSYDMLRLEDLRAISISTQADPVYGGVGGVVYISVKPGSLSYREDRNPSLLYFVPLGYQLPRYFELPSEDSVDSDPAMLPNTLWWSPSVKISQGRAEFKFPGSAPAVIRIEGQSADGRPFSCHCMVKAGN